MAAVVLARADDAGAGVALPGGNLRYSRLTRNWKHRDGRCAARRSVPRHRLIRQIEDRFRKRKLQHDLAFLVGHLDDRVDEAGMRAFDLENFPDHGARDFPRAVGVPQDFSVGINDQIVADPCIEKVSGHGLIQWGRARGIGSLTNFTSSLFAVPSIPSDDDRQSRLMWAMVNPLIPFWLI